jgi:hypothetical protein
MGNEAEKKASAGEAAKASYINDDDERVIRRTQYSTNGSGNKAPAEFHTEQIKQTEGSAKNSWQQADPLPIASDPIRFKVGVWKASECKTQLEAALTYAEYGVPVFPCNWKPEQRADGAWKFSKYPLVREGGLYLATIDPRIIKQWWTQYPKALIGVPMGRRVGMWAIDVDAAGAHAGDGVSAWQNLEYQHGESVYTRSHVTGTNGIHLFFRWDDHRPVGCPTSTVPKGMEVKGEGGYLIFPPSPYERNGGTVRYNVSVDDVPAAAPVWLYDLILGPRKRVNGAAGPFEWSDGFGKKKLDELCELVRDATQHHWDEACRSVFKFGKWVGGGAYDADKAWEELERAAEKCRAPADYPANVKRAFFNGVAQPEGPFFSDDGISLNDFCAYMPKHSYIYIPTRELWPASSVNARIPSVDSKIKAAVWLDQYHPVEQMTWAPGEEMLIRGRGISEGGWFKKDGMTCFNLYRGPMIELGDASKAAPWLDHVRRVFGDDSEHIIKWCAQRVQHPEIKINHALLLGSDRQGIGKDAALAPVKRAIGPWNFGEINPPQLLGRFNGFLKKVILRVNEARDLGDITRYQFYDHTKAYTASPPDTLLVDEKFLNEHQIINCVGLILTTNYKTNGIYLPPTDRRHYVAWTNVVPGDFPEGYWTRLWKWYDEDGARHVAAYLAGLDIAAFDPKEPPPKTQAFWDIVESNQAPQDAELADVLDDLGNPPAVTLQQVINKAGPKFSDWLQDLKNLRNIPHRFESCGYVAVRNPDKKDHKWVIWKKRQVIYALSELSLKDQIAAARELITIQEEVPDFVR